MSDQRTSAGHGSPQSDLKESAPLAGRPERRVLQLLRDAHERLADRSAALGPDDIDTRSFCTEWSIAQVFSHLGSGAELGVMALAAARDRQAPPDPSLVWNRWDTKAPRDMVADFVPADDGYVDALDEAIEAAEGGQALLVPIDGRPWPLELVMTARLVELALHEWDVAVIEDPGVEVDADAAAWTLATFPLEVAAQAAATTVAVRLTPLIVAIEICDPWDRLALELLPSGARLTRTSRPVEGADAVLTLTSAAAWMRLISGRWRHEIDDAPARITGELSVGDLYQLFPGF